MDNQTERNKLVGYFRNNYERMTIGDAEMAADFILADRARIVEPLQGLNGGDTQRGCVCCVELHKKITETLKRANGGE